MDTPSVSVIIPAYNCSQVIANAVGSALDQSVRPHEVIVVDDGSDDADALRAALAAWTRAGAVTLLETPVNSGPAAARNVGVRAATGDLIALLDADDRYEPGHLESAVRVLVDHPTAAMTCSDAYVVQDGVRLAWLKNHRRRQIPSVLDFETLLESNCVSTLTVVLRRELFETHGEFDEDPALYGVEDYDLWLRLSMQHEIRYVDRPLCSYARTAGSVSGDARRLYQGQVAVLDKLHRVVPDFVEKHRDVIARRQRYIRMYFAYNLCAEGRWNEARHAALRAVRHYPIDPLAYRMLVKSLLHVRSRTEWFR
ncbi:MAG: glycosyltransferase [Planctomycetota bacterium]